MRSMEEKEEEAKSEKPLKQHSAMLLFNYVSRNQFAQTKIVKV